MKYMHVYGVHNQNYGNSNFTKNSIQMSFSPILRCYSSLFGHIKHLAFIELLALGPAYLWVLLTPFLIIYHNGRFSHSGCTVTFSNTTLKLPTTNLYQPLTLTTCMPKFNRMPTMLQLITIYGI